MDRTKARIVGQRMEALMQSLGTELGMKIRYAGGTFGENTFTAKLECSEIVNGEVVTREVEDFKKLATCFGLKPEDIGREFKSGRDVYTIIGLKRKSREYPILAKSVLTGKVYKVALRNIPFADKEFMPEYFGEKA